MSVVVLMRRFGDPELHSYVLGVWKFLQGAAEKAGFDEQRRRGNKYQPEFNIINDKTGFIKEKWIGEKNSLCQMCGGREEVLNGRGVYIECPKCKPSPERKE